MEKSDKMKVFAKIQELFISKNRNLDDITAKVWVKNLCDKFPVDELISGIDKMIWTNDDFISLSKIAEFIREEKEFAILMGAADRALIESRELLQIENK